jgi:hypothetical protein
VLVTKQDSVRADRLWRLAVMKQTFQALPVDATVADACLHTRNPADLRGLDDLLKIIPVS